MSLSEMLTQPMYAAIFGAIIGIIAKMIDNRMSDVKGTFMGYLKSAAFGAFMIGLWTFILGKLDSSGARAGSLDRGSYYPAAAAAPRPRMGSFQPRPRPPFVSQGYN